MSNWWIYRNNQNYGPYSPEQLLSFESQGQLYPGDLYFDPTGNRWISIDEARHLWQTGTVPAASVPVVPSPTVIAPSTPPPMIPSQPVYVAPVQSGAPSSVNQTAPAKKGKRHGCGTVLLALLILAVGLTAFFILTKTSRNIIFGSRQNAAAETISATGGTISVTNPASPVVGMKINVPDGAYKENTGFKISTRPITSHEFGPKFNPVTPLITVDNGHEFSVKPMTVDIPIHIAPDEFAMAFYYDTKTGVLEGIPTVSLDTNHITIMTHHFSDTVVSKVKKSDLNNIDVDTGFRPGVDDWQFTNYGSFIAPGGHCAGQSISAMWYYYEKYLKAGERHLYGRFDNNDYGYGTIDFWQDDSRSYRFASVVHATMDEVYGMRPIFTTLGSFSDNLTMDAFLYSMVLTKEPQYVAIGHYYKDKNGDTVRGGHAIVAYRVTGDRIYVADPNFPGQGDRFIRFNDFKFLPYSSGDNALDIKTKGATAYTEIRYLAKSAMVNWGKIEDLYQQMLKGTIGDDKFGNKITYRRLTKFNPANGATEWEDCPDLLKLDGDTTAKVSPNDRGKLTISVRSGYTNQYTTLYRGLEPVAKLQGPKKANNIGAVSFTINLEKGTNDLGFLTEYTNSDNELLYADFKRIKVLYEQEAEMSFEKEEYNLFTLNKNSFKVEVKDAPGNVKYVWDFDDGTNSPDTDKPESVHGFAKDGNYVASVKMVDKKTNNVLAEAKARINVVNIYGTWKLDYTIKEAGAVDNIINMFVQAIVRVINMFVQTGKNPEDIKVTIEGTVIGCEMAIIPPVNGDTSGKITVQMRQLTSSTDFVKPATEVWYGTMTLDDQNKAVIKFTSAEGSEGSIVPLMTFKGKLDGAVMNGDFSNAMFSGIFTATRR